MDISVPDILFGLVLILITSALLYDLAYYDPSYINRKPVTFSVNNLNSRKVIKLFIFLLQFYLLKHLFIDILKINNVFIINF